MVRVKNSGFTALKLLKQFVNKVIAGTGAGTLFAKIPTGHFYPETLECPACGSMPHIRKPRTKTAVTMDIGAFCAKETVLSCPHDQTVFASEQLRSLVPERGTCGFDVIVEVATSSMWMGR